MKASRGWITGQRAGAASQSFVADTPDGRAPFDYQIL
jgi:hypothetical protein